METIRTFTGQHEFCSNFFVEPDGTTVEHEYQADKTDLLAEKLEIWCAATPGQAKRLGRKCTARDDWEQIRVSRMRDRVLKKFFDHRELADQLLATGGAKLIEGNHWHDNFWGDCTCTTCGSIPGQNVLGITLMDVRDLIASFR